MPVELLVSMSFAIFIGGGAWLAYSFITQGSRRMDERLQKIGRDQGRAVAGGAAPSGAERFQKLLEDAAPKLAEQIGPQSVTEQSEMKLRLAHAGWRGENVVAKYLVIRFAFLLVGLVLSFAFILPAYGLTQDFLMWTAICTGGGYYLPELFLRFRTGKRQESIFLGLPDALDLMVVCVEAGLGLDAAMRKVCEEMGMQHPIISEEFSICNFQLQMGRPRREVLHDLGQRTGVDDMKSLAAILIQADRFGASIAQALRVQSDSMRVRRRQLAEERAAKCAVKLIIPLVLFIFPAIFIVLVGPAGIQIAKTMGEGL